MRPTLTLEVAIFDVPERNQEFEHAFDIALHPHEDEGLYRSRPSSMYRKVGPLSFPGAMENPRRPH